MAKKSKNQAKKSSLRLAQFKENKEKPPAGSFANAVMYYVVSLAFGLILYGVFALFLFGGSPQGLAIGISMILLGLIILGLAAMSSRSGV